MASKKKQETAKEQIDPKVEAMMNMLRNQKKKEKDKQSKIYQAMFEVEVDRR